MDDADKDYLKRHLARADVVLFTGAGFSADTTDRYGRKLPLGAGARDELWNMCFPNEVPDAGSTLQDVFEIALNRKKGELAKYLVERFSIDPASINDGYATIFSAPWHVIYTVNVDDLEDVTATAFDLPRQPRGVATPTGVHNATQSPLADELVVVHLNGRAADGPEAVTFSTTQYARRSIGSADVYYPQLVNDIVSRPVVYVGTVLEEPTLWQYIELRGIRGSVARELRPKSFLITKSLPRARAELLKQHNVHFLPGTAADLAEILRGMRTECIAGLARLADQRNALAVRRAIRTVAECRSGASVGKRGTNTYLLGGEPQWSDLVDGTAITRASDKRVTEIGTRAMASKTREGQVLILSGTAGSGKSTALKRLALRLSDAGHNLSWIDDEAEVTPRELSRHDGVDGVFIDNADRYGVELPRIARSLVVKGKMRLLAVALRATQVDRFLESNETQGMSVDEVSIPLLEDADIDALIGTLEKHGLLGKLKPLDDEGRRKAFRDKSGRQLLVAMIEATSSNRFDDKVYDEWKESGERAQYVYGLLAVAYALGHSLTRAQVLIAAAAPDNAMLNALAGMLQRGLIVEAAGDRLRPRHKLIAERLVDTLLGRHREFALTTHARLAFVAAVSVGPTLERNARGWRLLKAVLNHTRLWERYDYAGACQVYDGVRDVLSWDYHYFLQRGSLELEHGSVTLAENYIEQAYGLEARDHKVITARSYMLLRKASGSPDSARANDWAKEAIDALLDLIQQRGEVDSYPYHVLGSQGLKWARSARITRAERSALTSRLLGEISAGLKRHPRNAELKQLKRDLETEYLSLAVS